MGSEPSTRERNYSDTHLALACALTFGLDARNRRAGFIEHCARVAFLVDGLAARAGIPREQAEEAVIAARLHEVGMVTVPAELLETPRALSADELARVRQQAEASATIARATQSETTALLIRQQYVDFDELRGRLPPRSLEVLLAGILRVADVYDALMYPRPYQQRLPAWYPHRIIREGAGRKFHPEAAALLLEHVSAAEG
jgi:putative two-component system response regulator